jgi:hypothetical protein
MGHNSYLKQLAVDACKTEITELRADMVDEIFATCDITGLDTALDFLGV